MKTIYHFDVTCLRSQAQCSQDEVRGRWDNVELQTKPRNHTYRGHGKSSSCFTNQVQPPYSGNFFEFRAPLHNMEISSVDVCGRFKCMGGFKDTRIIFRSIFRVILAKQIGAPVGLTPPAAKAWTRDWKSWLEGGREPEGGATQMDIHSYGYRAFPHITCKQIYLGYLQLRIWDFYATLLLPSTGQTDRLIYYGSAEKRGDLLLNPRG